MEPVWNREISGAAQFSQNMAEGLGLVTSSYSERSDLWRILGSLYSRPRPPFEPDHAKFKMAFKENAFHALIKVWFHLFKS